MTRTLFASLSLLALAACGGGGTAGKSTTKLDAVEVQPGSVSDSMIILDNAAGDGTAIDNSVPDDGTKKNAAKPATDTAAESDDTSPAAASAVEAPVAAKAVTSDNTAKKSE